MFCKIFHDHDMFCCGLIYCFGRLLRFALERREDPPPKKPGKLPA